MLYHLTPEELALIRQLLRPRVRALTDLLEAQVQASPPGCDDWSITAEALAIARGALVKVLRP